MAAREAGSLKSCVVTDAAVGIDLGTTYSCVAVYKKGRVHVIKDNDGSKLIPSVVAFTRDGEKIHGHVGRSVTDNMEINENHIVSEVKRLIGRRFDDPAVQANINRWPFDVTADRDGNAQVTVCLDGEKKIPVSPPLISAKVLNKLKKMAEKYLEENHKDSGPMIRDVVITVPAYFNNLQRKATQEAAKVAGLKIITMINEPSAAALAYGIRSKVSKSRTILVVDVGGGTSDIALIKVEGEKYDVIVCKGDGNLGGEDFDTNLVNYCVEQIENLHGIDVSLNPLVMRRLRNKCQFIKCKLSENPAEPNYECVLELDEILSDRDVNLTISREVFEEMNQHLFERAIALVPASLAEANMTTDDIDDIVPVGGSMRIPKLREMLQDFFQGRQLYGYINPDEAIAVGASILAAQKSGLYHGHIILSDITPYAIGIMANKGQEMFVLIPRNSKIPCESSDDFFTMNDYQRDAVIKVYQGENKFVKDNIYLGETTITGLRLDLSRKVKIVVRVKIDENGILTVTATEVETGNEVEESLDSLLPFLNVLGVEDDVD